MSEQDELTKRAEAWANERCPEQGPEYIVWCMCMEDYKAGAMEEREKLITLINEAPDNEASGNRDYNQGFCQGKKNLKDWLKQRLGVNTK